MSDQDRARAFSDRFSTADGPLLVTGEERALAREFAAVREDERRAIVADLEEFRSQYVSPAIRTILHVVAERIRIRDARALVALASGEEA